MFDALQKQLKSRSAFFEVTGGIALTILLSVIVCVTTSILEVPVHTLGVDSSVFTNGHVYKLLSYPFIHCDAMHLLVSAGVLVGVSRTVEKGHGTVWFLVISLLLSTITGLFFALLAFFLLEPSGNEAMGFVPMAMSLLGMVTIGSRLKRAFFFGISVPTALLPWILLLLITLFIPGMILLCNLVAIVVGIIYGKGFISPLEMSESRAALLEKTTPFRFLRRIMGTRFVPASAEERREILLTSRCKPSPGSYPVQAYAPASAVPFPSQVNISYEGWSNSIHSQHGPPSHMDPQGHSHSPACPGETHSHAGHGHGHGHGHGGHEHYRHGHIDQGPWHSHASHGHTQSGYGHNYVTHGHVAGHHGHHTHSQHLSGLGLNVIGQYGVGQRDAGASPAGNVRLQSSGPILENPNCGQETAKENQAREKDPQISVQT